MVSEVAGVGEEPWETGPEVLLLGPAAACSDLASGTAGRPDSELPQASEHGA